MKFLCMRKIFTFIFIHYSYSCSARNSTYCSYHLKLGGSFVYICNTCITIMSFHTKFLHIPGSTMNLNCIIGNLVGHFCVKGFNKWCKQICKSGIPFEICFKLCLSFRIFFSHLFKAFFHIYKSRCFVKKCPCCFDRYFHLCQHFKYRREFPYWFIELDSFSGILVSFSVGRFCYSQSLSGYT